MKSTSLVRIVMLTLILITAFTMVLTTATAAAPITGVKPPDGTAYYGHTYGEWSAAWWQWMLGQGFGPFGDQSGANCADGQDQAVWFLAGGPFPPAVERDCTIPANTPIFFPVANMAYLPTNQAHNDNVTSGRQITGNFMDKLLRKRTFRVEIDGAVIDHEQLKQYRVASPAFEAVYFGASYDRIVADGVYLLLEPLTTGPHTIRFTVLDWTDVTYHLTVQ